MEEETYWTETEPGKGIRKMFQQRFNCLSSWLFSVSKSVNWNLLIGIKLSETPEIKTSSPVSMVLIPLHNSCSSGLQEKVERELPPDFKELALFLLFFFQLSGLEGYISNRNFSFVL